ncbi:MAG: hypothetical protein AB1941_10830 [Gemmatimonadota bacterium]
MLTFDDAAALAAYKDWTATANTLWTIFSGAAIGFGGAAMKIPPLKEARVLRLGLGLAWVVFALGNATALYRVQRLVAVIVDGLHARAAQGSNLDPAYRPIFNAAFYSSPEMVVTFQAVLSIIFLAAILWIPPQK